MGNSYFLWNVAMGIKNPLQQRPFSDGMYTGVRAGQIACPKARFISVYSLQQPGSHIKKDHRS